MKTKVWAHRGASAYAPENTLEAFRLAAEQKADGFQDVPGYAAGLGADALHPALYNLQYEGFLKACREKKLLLHVWTVDDEKYMRRLVQEGIDAIITNKPDVARRIVDNG